MSATLTQATPNEVARVMDSGDGCVLIDVRTPAEFREVHADGARNIPLDRLDESAVRQIQQETGGESIYVICQSGARGAKGCEALAQAGLKTVMNVEGGTLAWEAAGLPVVRGKKTISLERQVRIAAGTLVFIGALLAWQVHLGFLTLPALVGAGLVFAGVTNTCGMGMMLAKMPWNQVKACDTK